MNFKPLARTTHEIGTKPIFSMLLIGCMMLSLAGFSQQVTTAAAPPDSPNSTNATTPVELSPQASASHLTNTHYVSPYQAQVKAFHLTGAVLLEAIINKSGVVTSVKVLQSTNKLLNKAAMDTVQHWVYKPYIHNGVPTDVVTTITVNFAPGRED